MLIQRRALRDLVTKWQRRYSNDDTNPIVQVTGPKYCTGIAPRITRGGLPFDPTRPDEA